MQGAMHKSEKNTTSQEQLVFFCIFNQLPRVMLVQNPFFSSSANSTDAFRTPALTVSFFFLPK